MQGHTVYDVGILDLEIWITVGAKRGSYPYGFGRDGAIPDSGYLPYQQCWALRVDYFVQLPCVEVVFEGADCSIWKFSGAKEVAVERVAFSKTYSMQSSHSICRIIGFNEDIDPSTARSNLS